MTAKFKPDYSLERDGRSLKEWLWLLVGDSQEDQIKAAQALGCMQLAHPFTNFDWQDFDEQPNVKEQFDRFAEGVRSVLALPDFDTRLFIQKLCKFRILTSAIAREASKNLSECLERIDDKFERIQRKIDERFGLPTDECESSSRARNSERLLNAYGSLARHSYIQNLGQPESEVGFCVISIINLLSHEFMSAPESLEAILKDESLRHEGLAILARIGPPAVVFAARLLKELDESIHLSLPSHFYAGHALGSIARGHADAVGELVDRFKSGNDKLRRLLVNTFEHLGPHACGREREICDLLLATFDRDDVYVAAGALASVGPDFPDVRKRIIELACPRPPKWREDKYAEGGRRDITMVERATAIEAMAYLTAYPNECVPILIDAIDSFVEFDPDETYDGPVRRIATVLAEFGETAADAAEPLANRLCGELNETPRYILYALASMGGSAKCILPTLRAFHEVFASDIGSDLDKDVIDESYDLVGWTIQQIMKA